MDAPTADASAALEARSAIGILLPVKEFHPAFLRRALESVVAQHDPTWRLWIVAEAGGLARLRAAAGGVLGDPRVEVLRNEGRKLAGAFNTGMRHAATEFVAILLGDDLWAPDAVGVLRRQIAAHPRADFFHSSRRIIDEHDRPVSSIHYSKRAVRLADFVLTSPVKHLLCWRRTMALSVGGMDESLNSVGPDDFDFPWTMAEHGAAFVAVRECLYYYRDHRECYRLTTHLPLSLHVSEIRRIMAKHGASQAAIAARTAHARRTYLRQCLYRTALDKWVKERLGRDPRRGEWEAYT
jgi:hypothetical protein